MKNALPLLLACAALATIGTVAFSHAQQSARPATTAAAAGGTAMYDPALMDQGRAVTRLVVTRDADALFARFTPAMASAVPKDKLAALLAQLPPFAATAPIPTWEQSITRTGAAVTYAARLPALTGDTALTVTFDGDRIAGLLLTNAPPLPEAEAVAARKAGRLAVAQTGAADAAALHARFAPRFAAQVAEKEVRQVLGVIFPEPVAGLSPLSDSVTVSDRGALVYTAICADKSGKPFVLTATFADRTAQRFSAMLVRYVVTGAAPLPPDPRAGYKLKATLRLPFAPGDVWTVCWGGDTQEQNYHAAVPDQRHATDFFVVRGTGTHTGDGSENAQYFAWDKPVLAPAPGTVVKVENSLPDTRNPDRAFGNHVILDLGGGEYATLAHLRHNSVCVHVGDTVKAGDPIGRCGNSGNSSEPHLHFQLQDKPYLYRDSISLPAPFTGYTANGKRVAVGVPVRGEVVQSLGF